MARPWMAPSMSSPRTASCPVTEASSICQIPTPALLPSREDGPEFQPFSSACVFLGVCLGPEFAPLLHSQSIEESSVGLPPSLCFKICYSSHQFSTVCYCHFLRCLARFRSIFLVMHAKCPY